VGAQTYTNYLLIGPNKLAALAPGTDLLIGPNKLAALAPVIVASVKSHPQGAIVSERAWTQRHGRATSTSRASVETSMLQLL